MFLRGKLTEFRLGHVSIAMLNYQTVAIGSVKIAIEHGRRKREFSHEKC